ncbi:MAG TPA: hypothetical protein VFR58_13430 [Flavisolibacter sp.]|nr:hypothetical protein [Flavisolibacter sp.]
MKKWSISGLAAILTLLILSNSSSQDIQLLRVTELSHYPSASTLEYHKDKLYVIGDDARQVLVLDKDHQLLDSISLFEGEKKQLSKKTKPDIESTIQVKASGKDYLLAFSSLSGPRRNKVLWIDLEKKTRDIRDFSLTHPEIREWNIEGTALVGNKLILSNRANGSHPYNHILVTDFDPVHGIKTDSLRLIRMDLPKNKFVSGLSSIIYYEPLDMLLFAASTEYTDDAQADGAIGDSYIGYIKNFSRKMSDKTLEADAFFNISGALRSSGPQKIESLVVEEQSGEFITIHLASDNDDGESTLFKMKWRL